MIVFLKIDEQIIEIYTDSGKKIFNFEDVNKLYEYVDNEKVYYITNATETDVKSIVSLIESVGVKVKPVNPIFLSNKKYIHSISNGTIIISEDIKFNGKYDIKDYDEEMIKNVDEFPLLKTLIEKNKIEIIGESKKYQILKDFKEEMNKKKEKQKKVDEKIDSIILKKSVADYDGMDEDEDGGEDENVIDITSDVNSNRNPLTENEQIMKTLGIN